MLLIEIEANFAVVRFYPCLGKLRWWHKRREGKVTVVRERGEGRQRLRME